MEKTIVDKIRQIRQNRKITLKILAEKTGLTEGYLSKIENSKSAPPIPTLRRIASALEIDISYFFLPEGSSQDKNPDIVIERGVSSMEAKFSGKPFRENEYGYQYLPLALNKHGKNMEPYLFSPDRELAGVVRFDGEVFFYILQGKIELHYGIQKYTLSEGDCAYFDAHIPFQTRSLGEEKALFFSVVYPYKKNWKSFDDTLIP